MEYRRRTFNFVVAIVFFIVFAVLAVYFALEIPFNTGMVQIYCWNWAATLAMLAGKKDMFAGTVADRAKVIP